MSEPVLIRDCLPQVLADIERRCRAAEPMMRRLRENKGQGEGPLKADEEFFSKPASED